MSIRLPILGSCIRVPRLLCAAGLSLLVGSVGLRAAGGADYSGLDRFFEVASVLEADQEPTPAQWDALFATPGYRVLLQREFRPDFFQERFRLALMPSKAAALQERLKQEKGFQAPFLPHYQQVKARRAEIQRWMADRKPEDMYAKAIARAKPLLPEGAVSGAPAVSFVVFAPDARGYDPVVLDVLFCMDMGERVGDLVAHEFYHYYRNRLVALGQDQTTLWVLNQVHNEGVADLIDKAPWLAKPEADLAPREKAFLKLYRETPAVIRTMDDLLSRMDGTKVGRGVLGEELQRAVPQSGHPTGFFMATTIQDTLGRAALVKVTDNPFAFFRLYQEAASRKDLPRFSPKALAFLDRLAARQK